MGFSTSEAKLTIGIPVFNGSRYLVQTLDSIREIRIPVKIIVSDNASTDDTIDILRRYSQEMPNLKIIKQSKTIGVISNFRAVLEECDTEYFSWLGADDFVSTNWFEANIENLKTNNGLVASIGAVELIDENSCVLHKLPKVRNLSFLGPKLRRRVAFFSQPNEAGRANLIYSVWRTQVLLDADYSIFEVTCYAPDSLFVYDCLAQGPISQISEVKLFKRIWDGVYSSGLENKNTLLIRVFNKLFRHQMWYQFSLKSTLAENALLPFAYMASVLNTAILSVLRKINGKFN